MDTTKFEAEDTIAELGGRDTLSAYVKPGKAEDVKVYDKWTGKEVTGYFDVTVKGQDVEVKVNAKGKKDGIVNTDLVKFGRRYQVDIPVTIREDAPSYTDIENVAEQFVTYVDSEGKKETVTKKTQKRVNQVRPKDPEPHKFTVKDQGFDVKGTSLLDDDSELSDRYEDTIKDPYADNTDNNEPENLNTQKLKAGDVYTYQVWMDTTPYNEHDTLQVVGINDDYDEQLVEVESVVAYDKETGKEATNLFVIEDKDGRITVRPTQDVKKAFAVDDTTTVDIIDTSKFNFGRYYQFDITVRVKDDVTEEVDIVNHAQQVVINHKGEELVRPTEKRVNPVTPNLPEPHKFTVKDKGFDVKGTSLLDDDSELSDRYEDTIKDPYVDKIDNNEPENHNTRPVSAGDLYTYQVWLDTTPYSERSTLQVVGIDDDYDEKLVEIESIVAYDKETGKEVTKLFDIEDTDGRITAKPTKDVKKAFAIDETTTVDIVDTSKLAFGRYYQFDITVRVKDDVADDVDIVNHAQQVVINHKGEELILPTEKRVNPVTSIVVQPHKFVLNQEGFDVTGTKLLDDDSELSDRYVDTNKDPYVDKTDNNEPENVNTQTVNPGDKLYYQVWMDTTPYNKDSLLQSTGIEDDYDQDKVRIVDVKVRNKKTGKEVTDLFKIEDKNGVLVATPKAEVLKDLEGVQVIDTDKFELGAYYQFDITAQVKDDVALGTDIVNTAKQIIITREGKKLELATEKRVNKTPEKKKGILPNTGEAGNYLLTGAGVVLLGILAFLRKRKDEE
ncbi:LPXTG cell wall anchor domain-containing protein [Streptococcus suis]|nr:LPXTG cell wall anchor domain-containing protein [Streptococcus suis]